MNAHPWPTWQLGIIAAFMFGALFMTLRFGIPMP